jgi:hypothetical protein
MSWPLPTSVTSGTAPERGQTAARSSRHASFRSIALAAQAIPNAWQLPAFRCKRPSATHPAHHPLAHRRPALPEKASLNPCCESNLELFSEHPYVTVSLPPTYSDSRLKFRARFSTTSHPITPPNDPVSSSIPSPTSSFVMAVRPSSSPSHTTPHSESKKMAALEGSVRRRGSSPNESAPFPTRQLFILGTSRLPNPREMFRVARG